MTAHRNNIQIRAYCNEIELFFWHNGDDVTIDKLSPEDLRKLAKWLESISYLVESEND